MRTTRSLTQKDLVIGLLAFFLIFALGQDYLFPSRDGRDLPRNSSQSHYARRNSRQRNTDYDM